MKTGRTIGAKRERVESESDRLRYRQKVKRKKLALIMIYATVLAAIVIGVIGIILGMRKKDFTPTDTTKVEAPTIEIVDEASVGVSKKVKEYVGYLEQDLKGYGITLTKAILPRNKTREVDVYIADFEGYFKLSLDRGVGVSAEDMDRMVRYLKKQGFIGVEYVDLRVEGKAYYKGARGPAPAEEPVGESSDGVPLEEEAPVEVVQEEPVPEETEVVYEEVVEPTPVETEGILEVGE